MPRSSAIRFGAGQAGVNIAAALDAVAYSELGPIILAKSDDGYNVVVGSTPQAIATFDHYTVHPNVLVPLTIKHKDGTVSNIASTAAGRYQTLYKYAVAYMKQLRLPDFGPESQDTIALQLMSECKAVSLFADGRFDEAIVRCNSRWASLPGAGYGQHENAIAPLRAAWIAAGGVLA